jgi:hypothetical protein
MTPFQQAALARVDDLRRTAASLLTQAENVCVGVRLPKLVTAQLATAKALAGADLHRISVYARPDEFARSAEDLMAICAAVDPLVEAIGAAARDNSHEISDRDFASNFVGQLDRALAGNATFNLEECARAAGGDADTLAETKREFERSE